MSTIASKESGLFLGPDGKARCFWCAAAPDYIDYHDREWGRAVRDDRRLFEKLCLEGFQSGLSWLTILRKREGFRRAFANFDFQELARFPAGQVDVLVADAAIVRHRAKIESVLNNARRACELVSAEGSLSDYVWRFAPAPASRPKRITLAALKTLTQSPESVMLSKDLKKRGWSFVGPTTAYAFMQSMGLVNDHIEGCFARTP